MPVFDGQLVLEDKTITSVVSYLFQLLNMVGSR